MSESRQQPDQLARDLTLYVLARFALVVLVAVVLVLVGVPLLVAVAVGIVAGLPLGLLFLRGLNGRVTAGLARRNEWRARERARLRAQLRGEDVGESRDDSDDVSEDVGETADGATVGPEPVDAASADARADSSGERRA